MEDNKTTCGDCRWFDRLSAIAQGLPGGLAPCNAMPPEIKNDGRGTLQIGHKPTQESLSSCYFFESRLVALPS